MADASTRGVPVIYLSGHDHAMQYLQDGDVHLIGCGVGGLNLHPLRGDGEPKELVWAANESFGFLVHEVLDEVMTTYFVDASQAVVVHMVSVQLRTVVQ